MFGIKSQSFQIEPNGPVRVQVKGSHSHDISGKQYLLEELKNLFQAWQGIEIDRLGIKCFEKGLIDINIIFDYWLYKQTIGWFGIVYM